MQEKTTGDYDLKPCPFCGGEAYIAYAPCDYNCWSVVCRNCGAMVEAQGWKGMDDTESNAVAAWNRRT